MANMATMIMEGATVGGKLSHHYDHENGAGLIAMESAEVLRDIFEASFYDVNTCEILAALEGATCVEESTQAAIMEAAMKSAFEKIKQFFINLKDKVKDFLHNIKRYLTGIFGNDEKWVKTYEKELKALSSADLKDYKVKMYNYTIMPALDKAGMDSHAEKLKTDIEKAIETGRTAVVGNGKAGDFTETLDDLSEKQYLAFINDLVGKSIDEDELDKELWSMMRDGADSESDKEDVAVAGKMSSFIEELKKSSKAISAYDSMISRTDSMYAKLIKTVDNEGKKYDKIKFDDDDHGTNPINSNTRVSRDFASNVVEAMRKLSSVTSKMQTAENKKNNAAKSALVERNSAYKSALTGAFAYARKNKGGK